MCGWGGSWLGWGGLALVWRLLGGLGRCSMYTYTCSYHYLLGGRGFSFFFFWVFLGGANG